MLLFVGSYVVLMGLLLFVLLYQPARRFYVPVKTATSITFVGMAIYCGIAGNHREMLLRMMPGFLMCLCGDISLGFYNDVKKKKWFLAGVFTFLLGHIFFIFAMVSIQRLSWIDFIFPVCGIGITMLTTWHRKMRLGKLKPYVYVYSFFVAMLFSKSIHILLVDCSRRTLCLGIGSGLFLLSDFLILFLYFYEKRHWSTHGWNLVTYYSGMALLAISLLYS